MSVEILTVSLSADSIEKLADAVAARLGTQVQGTLEVAAPQPQDDDPWAGTKTAPGPTQGQQQQYQQQPTQQRQEPMYHSGNQGQGQPVQGGNPTCAHGPMRYIQAGFSQSTGRAYPAFYGCTAPRGAVDKCKSVPA